MSKNLSQSGYSASGFLENISKELTQVKEELESFGETEKVIAEYLESALHEIEMSRYLELVMFDLDELEEGSKEH